jgi:hypothetical protein
MGALGGEEGPEAAAASDRSEAIERANRPSPAVAAELQGRGTKTQAVGGGRPTRPTQNSLTHLAGSQLRKGSPPTAPEALPPTQRRPRCQLGQESRVETALGAAPQHRWSG